jgi:hypothetical protein
MNRCATFLLVFFVFSFFACKKTDQQREAESIQQAMKHIHLKSTTDWLVVLPGLGCTGCIQEGEAFVKDNINNSKIFFVITKFQSLKILQQKIGKKIVGLPNVYIDSLNSFAVPTSNGIYPCIAQLKGEEIIKHEFQSPRNGQAFEQLRLKSTL